jgi:hypothetical protein
LPSESLAITVWLPPVDCGTEILAVNVLFAHTVVRGVPLVLSQYTLSDAFPKPDPVTVTGVVTVPVEMLSVTAALA